MGKNQWIIPTNKGWGVKGEGNKKLSFEFNTKQEAIKKGVEIAKNQKAELIIQKKDGTIRNKYSYGNKPTSPKCTIDYILASFDGIDDLKPIKKKKMN